jgi:ankyrin repeat protein
MLLKGYLKCIDLDAVDKRLSRTALHIAAYKGNVEIVEMLLGSGAHCNLLDKKGNTALKLCYQNWILLALDDTRNSGYEQCIQLLIKANREAAVADTNLLSTASIRGNLAILEALISGEPKADPILRDEYGWTAIDLAKQYQHRDAVGLLSERGGTVGKFPSKWVVTAPKTVIFSEETGELKYIGESEGDGWQREFILFPFAFNINYS